MNKKHIRNSILKHRDKLLSEEVKILSLSIWDRLLTVDAFTKASQLLVYRDYRNEVATLPIIKYALSKNIPIAAPMVKGSYMDFYYFNTIEDFHPGTWGILEPDTSHPYNEDDSGTVVIMPGSAYDLNHNRIGYGGGYYDKYLANHPDIYRIAIGYDFQIVDFIPAEDTDIKPHMLVTDRRIII